MTKRELFPRLVTAGAAARATAQFLPADPALWLERCALAGITVGLWEDSFYELYENGSVRADPEQVTFLTCWLNLTPGGQQAVAQLLRKRHGVQL
jgi:hypothetical protein